MDTVPFRRCACCHNAIEPGEQHWTLSGTPAQYPKDYCVWCVRIDARPLKRSVLGELLEDQRQAELKRRPRR
jgi:hypothetical protein